MNCMNSACGRRKISLTSCSFPACCGITPQAELMVEYLEIQWFYLPKNPGETVWLNTRNILFAYDLK